MKTSEVRKQLKGETVKIKVSLSDSREYIHAAVTLNLFPYGSQGSATQVRCDFQAHRLRSDDSEILAKRQGKWMAQGFSTFYAGSFSERIRLFERYRDEAAIRALRDLIQKTVTHYNIAHVYDCELSQMIEALGKLGMRHELEGPGGMCWADFRRKAAGEIQSCA